MSSYSEKVRIKARSIVLLCDKDYPGLASMFALFSLFQDQNSQQVAGNAKEGK